MIVLLNSFVLYLHITVFVLIVFAWLGNFFKKKTMLEPLHLYGDQPIFISIIAAFCNSFLLLADFQYAYNDFDHTSYTLGTLVTGVIVVMILGWSILVVLFNWQSKIKET